jgi:hypothetical protein
LLATILLIVNHLGKNPKNGGNPPKERKFKINKNLIFFLNENTIDIWFK